MSKKTEKKPMLVIGKPKADVTVRAAQNDNTPAEKPKQKRLNVNIDLELHSRFKKTVTNKDQDMSKVVTALLEQWLKENE